MDPSASFTHTLTVTLTHARSLPVADYTGTSDPFVRFQLDDGQNARSSVRPSTLDPVWDPPEHFQFKLRDPEQQVLVVELLDHDFITHDDLLGSLRLPLRPFLHATPANGERRGREAKVQPLPLPSLSAPPLSPSLKVPLSDSYTLTVPATLVSATSPPSTVFLRIAVVPLDALSDVRLEVYENEYWSLGLGWSSDESVLVAHRRRWSSEDGATSSDAFDKVAAKVPFGFESSGWSFYVGRGDRDGWLYATTFAGPWYPDSTPTTLARRRKWENVCRQSSLSERRSSLQF